MSARVSVVICTYDRAHSLRETLRALREQTYREFEVVVVNGPSTDATAELLAAEPVRAVDNPLRHLSRSRNLGIAAAAGDLVAFIDDDAVPEPTWLEQLAAPFADPAVGAVGGMVLDHTGVKYQWRYLVCARSGEANFNHEPPLDRFCGPGADPFLYVAGGNSMFRREALVQVGGFDEEIEYDFDETAVCVCLHDAGWAFRALDGALVLHRFLPSHQRSERAFTDPFAQVKNAVYFGLRHARPGDALIAANRRLSRLKAEAREAAGLGRLDDLERYLGRADAGFHAGLQRGLHGQRRSVALPPPDPAAFRPYPAGAEHGHRLVLVGRDEPHRLDYEDGVWIRRVPVRQDPDVILAGWERHLRPRRDWPLDWAAEACEALAEPTDAGFADRLYENLLGRAPDGPGRAALLGALGAGRDRLDVVREMAASDEARWHGVDPGFVARLPSRTLPQVAADLRRARMREDEEAFAQILAEAAGVPGAEHLPPADVRTAGELRAELDALPDDGFLEGAYRLLLGRPADPDGLKAYAGASRAVVVRALATSEEAARRGIDGERVIALYREGGRLRRALRRLRA